MMVSNGAALVQAKFAEGEVYDSCPLLDEAERQVKAYFDGRLPAFTIPLAPVGTDFQQRVWQQVLQIAYGSRRSYGQIAAALNMPHAARAVGHACGKNPVLLFIPCLQFLYIRLALGL